MSNTLGHTKSMASKITAFDWSVNTLIHRHLLLKILYTVKEVFLRRERIVMYNKNSTFMLTEEAKVW